MTASDRRIALGLFALLLVTYAWFFSGGGWNQNAHFDLTRALVERQTLHIDGYHQNTGDVSWSRASGLWHVYINKPPGVSFLAAVPYALMYVGERMLGARVDGWFVMTVNAWIVTILTCGVAGALIPAVLYAYGRRVGISPRGALAVALAIGLGTIVFPYSTLLIAHVPPALFLLLAFYWMDERPLLAGVCAGVAGASYYLCIPAAAILLLGIWSRGGARAAARFALGGLPFGALLLLYQWLCFGSPFTTSLEISDRFTEQGLLFGVFRTPSLQALWGLTFGDYRGLFFVSPILLLAVIGAVRMPRRELLLIGSIVLFFLLAVASFNQWWGGYAFGPRYILPIVPLLGVAMLYLRGRWVVPVGLLLGLISFGMQLMATAVNPTPSSRLLHPVQDYLFPRFVAGMTSVNGQGIDEIGAHQRSRPGSQESLWNSFNAGELVTGPTTTLSLLPLLAVLLAGTALLWRRASAPVP
ncbi:MAG: hypothetical protein ABI779_02555 [Acidobacteriota bacterium]